jgi:hypothetical protein|tara:strand:+ start:247 stop:570 length:324 start_codon:yes stop_codon:yes gene_type:complete
MINKPKGKRGGNRGGRPKGSGQGQQVVARVRMALEDALGILETEKNTSLAELLANELYENPSKCLNALGKFVPTDVSVEHRGNLFMAALTEVAASMEQIQEQDEKLH